MSLKKNTYAYLFITPFILAFLIFGLYPIYNTFYLSFTDYTILSRQGEYIGWKNFERLFADDFFMTAVKNTWMIWILNFLPQLGIALLLSVWFTNAQLKLKGVGVWRALFFLPNLLMPAVVAALFFALFAYYGPVNQILVRAGIFPDAQHFLEKATVAQSLVVFIQWWTWFGQTAIIVMAGMTAIPIPLYEAAMVDGATSTQMFWRITVPLLKPILIFIFVTSLVGGMQMFDIPFLLTDGRGGPTRAILTNNILMYMKFASSKGHIGAASSVGVLIFVMTTICALGIFYFMRERNDEAVEMPKSDKTKSKQIAKRSAS